MVRNQKSKKTTNCGPGFPWPQFKMKKMFSYSVELLLKRPQKFHSENPKLVPKRGQNQLQQTVSSQCNVPLLGLWHNLWFLANFCESSSCEGFSLSGTAGTFEIFGAEIIIKTTLFSFPLLLKGSFNFSMSWVCGWFTVLINLPRCGVLPSFGNETEYTPLDVILTLQTGSIGSC